MIKTKSYLNNHCFFPLDVFTLRCRATLTFTTDFNTARGIL